MVSTADRSSSGHGGTNRLCGSTGENADRDGDRGSRLSPGSDDMPETCATKSSQIKHNINLKSRLHPAPCTPSPRPHTPQDAPTGRQGRAPPPRPPARASLGTWCRV